MSSVAVSNASLSPIKNYRKAVVRVLSGGQTRTWNVTVDFVAQTGRFSGAQTNGDSVFEGGNRAWISVAIDLFTSRNHPASVPGAKGRASHFHRVSQKI